MSNIAQHPTDEITCQPHHIHRCRFCRERFGTLAALRIHKPKPADKRARQLKETGKVKRSRCASEKTMERAGCWRGHGGVWWTKDGGWSDQTETLPFWGLQDIENEMVISDKIATLASAIPKNQKPHNGAGFNGSVSKFRKKPEAVN